MCQTKQPLVPSPSSNVPIKKEAALVPPLLPQLTLALEQEPHPSYQPPDLELEPHPSHLPPDLEQAKATPQAPYTDNSPPPPLELPSILPVTCSIIL